MTAIKEKPMIYQAASVRAILDDRKTQTRRVMKENAELAGYEPHRKSSGKQHQTYGAAGSYYFWFALIGENRNYKENLKAIKCPYPVGTRVWIKEAWYAPAGDNGLKPSELPVESLIFYASDNPKYNTTNLGKYRNALFMPRWASRITLEITDVRVERVQDISWDDAVAEGCDEEEMRFRDLEIYAEMWDSINAKRGYPWSDEDLPDNLKTGHGRIMYGNPWVWAYTFKRIGGKK